MSNKDSFGYLDVLYLCDSKINTRELVTNLFNPTEIVTNGDVMSFDYDNFQIDFIVCNTCETLNSSQFYFSNSDLWAIIGRIVNYYGIKFGHYGLWTMDYVLCTIDYRLWTIYYRLCTMDKSDCKYSQSKSRNQYIANSRQNHAVKRPWWNQRVPRIGLWSVEGWNYN